MQENENLHAKLALTEKQRDRVLGLRMNTELGPTQGATRSQLMDDALLREKLATAEAQRDEAQLDLTRAKQQLVTVQQVQFGGVSKATRYISTVGFGYALCYDVS